MREGVVRPAFDQGRAARRLAVAIRLYQDAGYAVLRQTATTAVLLRPQRWSVTGEVVGGERWMRDRRRENAKRVYLSVDAGGQLRQRTV